MRKKARLMLLVMCTAGQALPAGAQPVGSVDDLGWFAGCWVQRSGDRTVEEHWMTPAGGTMIGMSRTVSGDHTLEFEFVQIRREGPDLLYVAKPSRQVEASFRPVRGGAAEAVFENPGHDFPQRIVYRLGEDRALRARVEGTRDGTTPESISV